MRDVTLLMDMKVGRVAELLEHLAQAGVTPAGGCFFPRLEGRVAHVAVEEAEVETVRSVASQLDHAVLDEREVTVIEPVVDLAAAARDVADQGTAVYLAYFGPDGRLFLGVAD
ncbi:MAG TPA: hypothetical protein VJR05_11710 [Acidimicrobiia bacterium]|nr:hypothetical protein [Acidimicrobiia bacterium]